MEHKIHEGRNIKRFREMLGIKQEALAYELGEDWNQKKISLLEQKETVNSTLLLQISAVLKIPVEVFKTFNEEQAIKVITNSLKYEAPPINDDLYYIEKLIQLYEEIVVFYEHMLKEKEEIIVLLKKRVINQ